MSLVMQLDSAVKSLLHEVSNPPPTHGPRLCPVTVSGNVPACAAGTSGARVGPASEKGVSSSSPARTDRTWLQAALDRSAPEPKQGGALGRRPEERRVHSPAAWARQGRAQHRKATAFSKQWE